MNETDLQRIQDVFVIASGLKETERQIYLRRIAETDVILHDKVIALFSRVSGEKTIEITSKNVADDSPLENTTNFVEKTLPAVENNKQIVGKTLGNRYLITRLLGAGGIGEVFLAYDKNVMNREVVVKMLRDEVVNNNEVLRKFRHEIEALSRIKDEGIVTILDSGLHNEQPYLVLEYVESEDLSKIISPFLFSVKDFTNILNTVRQLREGSKDYTAHLWKIFKPETRETLNRELNEKVLAECLREQLNGLLGSWNLYDESAFASVKLSQRTLELLANRTRINKTVPFNRALLEDSFQSEIRSGGEKLIHQTTTAEIIRQLCIALSHGHDKGIIHRDLKPANIIIVENENRGIRVKLIDFGLAKVRDSIAAVSMLSKTTMGTQIYMSPEQSLGESQPTAASDIYTVGLIAIEMLTGKRVFEGKSHLEQFRIQESEQIKDLPVWNENISPEVKSILLRALSFKPENRQTVATDFGNEFAEAINNTVKPTIKPVNAAQVGIEPAKFADETKKTNGLLKWFLAAAAIVLIFLGIALVGGILWSVLPKNTFETVSNQNSNAQNFEVKRSLDYKLIVQKVYDGKPFQQPFEATGDEIFGDGWRFNLEIQSSQNGYFYLLTEGAGGLAILFPHPQTNDGKSFVTANQKIRTNQMSFDDNQGTENFWIVWAKNPVDEFEAVTSYVNSKDLGKIKNAESEKSVRNFLNKYDEKANLREIDLKSNANNQLKRLQASTDILIKKAEFRHN